MLTSEQQTALKVMHSRKNVFLTGPAGCGKTTIVQEFAKTCNNQGIIIALTALTGVAALHLGGRTLHSWAGIGLGKKSVQDLVLKILTNHKCLQRWRITQILVIDEVSMLSPYLLEKLDKIARVIRGLENVPFGGIQVIFTGDFCQLPPVKCSKFCFESPIWNQIIEESIYLTRVIRQSDPVFQQCLSEIRMGNCSQKTEAVLRSRVGRPLINNLGIVPTKLYSTRKDVNRINQVEINKLKQQGQVSKTYVATTNIESTLDLSAKQKHFLISRMEKDCVVPSRLEFVVGCQVMLVHNLDIDKGLVNGSRGVVIGLEEGSVDVRFLNSIVMKIEPHMWSYREEDHTRVTLSQIPLIVAYSGTIHKTQSQTLEYVVVDLGSSIFEYGQAYTALSRVRSLDGLQIESLQIDRIRTHPRVKAFYEILEEKKVKKNL